MAVMLEARVTNLEQMMADLMATVRETSEEVRRLSQEMDKLNKERRLSREKLQRPRETRESPSEKLQHSQEQPESEFRKWRIHWGNLTDKWGTMAEDLVAPRIPDIFRDVLNVDEEIFINSAMRVQRHHITEKGRQRVFDVIAFTDEYLFINETKSSLTSEKITKFVETVLPEVRAFMPEHADKRIVGAVSSLFIDESVVRYGERQGLIVLGRVRI